MRKNFCFWLSILVSSISNLAHADFYGLVNLGLNDVLIQKNLTYPLAEEALTQAQFKTAYQGFHGQLGLGYVYDVSSGWQLALEANADWFTDRSTYNINNWFINIPAAASENLRNSWNLYLLPAYHLNDKVQLFLGPGVSSGFFKVGSYNAPTGGNVGLSGRDSKYLTGWSLKTGASLALTDAWDLLLSYQYSNFESMTSLGREPLSTSLLRAQYKPEASIFMVGLKYVFNRGLGVEYK